jgi:hypothetical protein
MLCRGIAAVVQKLIDAMHKFAELARLDADGDAMPTFMVRWRGQKQGPLSGDVIERKLLTNEFGLLHEIYAGDRWLTIRDFVNEKEAVYLSVQQVKEESDRQAREDAGRQAKEREEQRQTELLAEERRRNDLMEASLKQQSSRENPPQMKIMVKPHRGGVILALGILGFFCLGIFGLFAWVMGSSDLQEMDAGKIDPSGRSTTAAGRTIGAAATILWALGAAIYFLSSR